MEQGIDTLFLQGCRDVTLRFCSLVVRAVMLRRTAANLADLREKKLSIQKPLLSKLHTNA